MTTSSRLKFRMERYRALKIELDQLVIEIKEEVKELGESAEGNGIKAAFSKPRRTYDYAGFCDQYEIEEATIKKHTTESVNWKAVADEIGIEDGELNDFTNVADEPSISLKVVEKED